MLGNKINLNKFKIEIISSIFSDYNSMKLEIYHMKKTEEKPHEYIERMGQWRNQEEI